MQGGGGEGTAQGGGGADHCKQRLGAPGLRRRRFPMRPRPGSEVLLAACVHGSADRTGSGHAASPLCA